MSGPTTFTLPMNKKKKNKKDTNTDKLGASDAVAHEQIRERAYYKWEEAGCPCCDDVAFWLEAEAEVIRQDAARR